MYTPHKNAKNAIVIFLILITSAGFLISSTSAAENNPEYAVSVYKSGSTNIVETAEGDIVYSGSNDLEALRAAVNSIDNGIILIDPGTYMISSPVSLKSNIEVIGNNAVLKGYKIFNINSATNVKISGLEFSNPDQVYGAIASGSGFINIVNSNSCLIQNNTFRNFRDYGVNLAVSSTSHKNEDITISHNQFLDFGYCGVMIWKQSYQIYVEDNTFKNINTRKVNANAYGIAIAKGSNSYDHSEYIYIRHNWIENNPVWEGIDSHGANHVYIQDNTVLDCKVPIAVAYMTNEGTYPLQVHDIVITGNYIKGNMDSPEKQHSGIHVLGARNYAQPYTSINVSGNTITDVNSWLVSDDGAIVLRDVNGGIIDNNLITGVGGTGINLQNADKLVIQNNEIKNLIPISGSTKGIEMQAVVKSFSTTIRDNDFDSSVGYHGYANSGYTYYTTLINEVQSKFGGYLSLSVQTDTPATSTVDPPLTPPEPRPLEETNDSDTSSERNETINMEYDVIVSEISDITVAKINTGNILYSGNNDADALRAAVNAIDEGTILVNAGTYFIDSSVSLKSNIEMLGKDAVIEGYSIFRADDLTNVTITGFTFSNPDRPYLVHAGSTGLVEIENSENCLIENNTFRNYRDYGIDLETRTSSSHNRQIIIRNNDFLDFGYCGVMIAKQASNIYVEDNTFRNIDTRELNSYSYGVAISKGSSTEEYSEYIYIRNNTIENNPAWEGIDSHGANYLFIENNSVIDCKTPIWVSNVNYDDEYTETVRNLSITGNYVKGNYNAEKQDSGIYVLGGHNTAGTIFVPYENVTVSDNMITDVNNWLVADDGAIVLHNVDEAYVDNNKISGVGGTAINLENADNVVMQNNSISNMRQISGSTRGLKLIPVLTDYNLELKNNIFDNSVDYDAYAYPDYGNVYQVSVTEQDTSKFYTSNGAIVLTDLTDDNQENQQETLVSILPLKNVVTPGDEYSVNIFIEPGTGINGAQFDLLFNSTMQSIISVTEGELFSINGYTEFYSGTVENDIGIVKNVYDAIIGDVTVADNGTMATVTLRAGSNTGHTALNLSNVVISDIDSNAVGHSISDARVLIDTAPVLQPIGSKTVDENQLLAFTVTADDQDYDKLSYTASGIPSGAVFDNDSGSFTWTPAEGQEGNYLIEFLVSDGYLQDAEKVSVTVNSAQHSPVITSLIPADDEVFKEKETINIVCEAYDADGDVLSYTIKIDDTIVSNDAAYVWETDHKSAGTYSIEVIVSDGNEEVSASRTISVLDMHPRWDINKDKKVDILDVTLVGKNHMKTVDSSNVQCDINEDNVIDIADLSIVSYHFGETIL